MHTTQYYHPRYGSWRGDRDNRTWRYAAAGVLALVFIGPVLIPAVAIAALIWGKRAFTEPFAMMRNWQEQSGGAPGEPKRRHQGWGWGCGGGGHRGGPHGRFRTSGNQAFDQYKADTLRRLEEEQEQFDEFLARLRAAKDKAEFDAFMNEQADRKSQESASDDDDGDLGDDRPVEAKK